MTLLGHACFVMGIFTACSFAVSVWAMPIDSFQSPSPAVVNTTAADGEQLIDGPRSGPGILGSRTVTKNGNAFEEGDSISVGDGALSIVSQPFFADDSTFTTQVIYDFTGEPGGSVSFAADTGLELTFTFVESYGFMGRDFLDSFIDIYTIGGDLQAVGIHYNNLPGGSRIDFVPFSSFAGVGDLSNVTGLRIWFNDPLTTPRIDYTLSHFASVPEPSSVVMLCVLIAYFVPNHTLRRNRDRALVRA